MIDPAAQTYIDAIAPDHRPAFDRIHDLVRATYPDVDVVLSYKMPTFAVRTQRLHVAVWKHGLSLYGWRADRDGGFVERHPDLANDKGTLRLRPADLDAIGDDELLLLLRGALDD